MGRIVKEDIPEIFDLLQKAAGSDACVLIERMGGLTNHTYHAVLEDGREYVVRIPGEGTEEMIVRSDEKISTELACRLDIDAQMLYFGDDGSKEAPFIAEHIREQCFTGACPFILSPFLSINIINFISIFAIFIINN